jgi:hypothetical protein
VSTCVEQRLDFDFFSSIKVEVESIGELIRFYSLTNRFRTVTDALD